MRFINARGTYECVTVCDQVAMSRENDLYFSIVTSLSRRVVAAVDSLHFNSFLISQRARREFSLSCRYFSRHKLLRVEKRSPRDLDTILRDDVESHDEYPRRSSDTHSQRGRENNRRFFFFLLTLCWSMQEFFSTSHFLAFRKGKKNCSTSTSLVN